MNSSTRNAMASEKTIPATSAIALIARCITASPRDFQLQNFSLPASNRGVRDGRESCGRGRRTAEYPGDFLVAFPVDFHRVSHRDQREQLHNVAIPQANAAVRGGFSDRC